MDCTEDPVGCEFVSLVPLFVDKTNLITECIQDKILSQCHQGVRVTSSKYGGMHYWRRLNNEVPFVHCFAHDLIKQWQHTILDRKQINIWASIEMGGIWSSILKDIFNKHRRSMLHLRKAQLIKLSFERDLTIIFSTFAQKERLLRRFNSTSRWLQVSLG